MTNKDISKVVEAKVKEVVLEQEKRTGEDASQDGERIRQALIEMYELGQASRIEGGAEGNLTLREYKMKLVGRKEGISQERKRIGDVIPDRAVVMTSDKAYLQYAIEKIRTQIIQPSIE